MAVDRVKVGGAGGAGRGGSFDPGKEWRDFAAIVAHLSDREYKGGGVRVPGSILIFVEDGMVKLALGEPDANGVAFISGRTPQEAFRNANEALATGKADWRLSREARKGQAQTDLASPQPRR